MYPRTSHWAPLVARRHSAGAEVSVYQCPDRGQCFSSAPVDVEHTHTDTWKTRNTCLAAGGHSQLTVTGANSAHLPANGEQLLALRPARTCAVWSGAQSLQIWVGNGGGGGDCRFPSPFVPMSHLVVIVDTMTSHCVSSFFCDMTA